MRLILIGILLMICGKPMAQKCGASFNFQLGYATGAFKSVNPNAIGGGRLNFTFRPFFKFPFYTGFELGYQRSNAATTTYYKGANLGLHDVYKVKSSNRIASALANARVSVPDEKAFFRPFIEGLAGASQFSTRISVRQETGTGLKKIDDTNSKRLGWAFTWGGSAGMNFRLNQRSSCYLQLKASYLFGAKAKYLADPSINNDGTATLAVGRSYTNMFIPQAGLYFNFN